MARSVSVKAVRAYFTSALRSCTLDSPLPRLQRAHTCGVKTIAGCILNRDRVQRIPHLVPDATQFGHST